MILPAADSFCNCVMLQNLGIFQKVYRLLGPQEVELVGWLLFFVGCSLSSSYVQRRNNTKKLDILMLNIKLVPRNTMPLIAESSLNDNVTPCILFSLLSSVRGLKAWKKRGGEGQKKEKSIK